MEKSIFEATLYVPKLYCEDSIDSDDYSLLRGFLFPAPADLPRGRENEGLLVVGGVG